MNDRRPSGTSIQWTSPRHPDIRHRGPERQPHDTRSNRPRSRADENLDQPAIICPHRRYSFGRGMSGAARPAPRPRVLPPARPALPRNQPDRLMCTGAARPGKGRRRYRSGPGIRLGWDRPHRDTWVRVRVQIAGEGDGRSPRGSERYRLVMAIRLGWQRPAPRDDRAERNPGRLVVAGCGRERRRGTRQDCSSCLSSPAGRPRGASALTLKDCRVVDVDTPWSVREL
jgi:hypothetical protein